MYLVKTPALLSKMTKKSLLWRVETSKKEIFLTFDDGPTPKLTEEVLAILESYNAKATFFCVGENAYAHAELMQKISHKGHRLGNHSYNHLNGWKTPNTIYIENVKKASLYIDSTLFRPPYGRISYGQIKLLKKDYRLVMWSVLSGDFDAQLSKEKCLENTLKCKKGDVVVFHDSLKAQEKLLYALPRFLAHYTKLGYKFCTL